MTVPEMETPRLRLRGHRLEDFGDCAAMWADPVVTRHIGGKRLSVEEAWAKFLRYPGHWALMGFGFWAIEEKATGGYAGELGFADFKREMEPSLSDVPEAGWVLTAATQGKGYATEALQAVLLWGDRHMKALRTVCLIHPDNGASIRVAEKCGYGEAERAVYKGHEALVFARSAFRIRRATAADVPALTELIDLSVRTLQAQDYSSAQIDGGLSRVFGTDAQLIADGTYFVIETLSGAVAGCGGWSKRKTLYGSDVAAGRDDDLLDPRTDAAKIRAFFIHPDWSRRGLGTMLLAACESTASEAGFASFEMGATLTGEKLFRARGYEAIERIAVPLGEGVSLPVIRMRKQRR